MFVRGDAGRLPFADQTFDLVVGSPPYLDARLYLEDGDNPGISRNCREWVSWVLSVTSECLRVSKGLVLWVCAGNTRDFNYRPAPEGLLWEWWKRGGECQCLRPVYWHRVGIPGSGADYWYRADVEYVLAFKRPGRPPYADPLANGHPPKWAPGGAMSYRTTDGTRANQWGAHEGTTGAVRRDGKRESGSRPSHRYSTAKELADSSGESGSKGYNPPVLANPGNLLHTNVGGGLMGHPLAHLNEAPFPTALPAFFIASHCPPGGWVLDPFSGSGSTVQAALELGRHAVGCDIRQSQCVLGRQRIRTVTPELPLSAS
jgi:hypothetical protein